MIGKYHILEGDCRAVLATMPVQSIHCCVTSPPYFGLRDYGTATWEGGDAECDHIDADKLAERHRQRKSMIAFGEQCDGSTRTRVHDDQIGKDCQYLKSCRKCGAIRIDSQIGLEPTPEDFVAAMRAVFGGKDNAVGVWRVLRDDGILWLNLGDSYAGTWGSGGRRNMIGNPSRTGRRDSVTGRGLKNKDLIGIPWRVAFALQADGWHLRDAIVWHKPAPMPGSQRDRCTSSYEFIFQLTKRARYFFDMEAIKEEAVCEGSSQSFSTPRNVWRMASNPFSGSHFATFPRELPTRCVKASTSEKGCCPECGKQWERVVESRVQPTCACGHDPVPSRVLDPFGGAGTTAIAACLLGRDCTLIELSQEYAAMSRKRVEAELHPSTARDMENATGSLFQMTGF